VTARLTAKQAKEAGIALPPGRVKKRVARGAAYHTLCKACGTEFHTQASEDRHLAETRHANYLLVKGH
jgi:hypothetical protein